jgi:hypothetical protein
MPQRDDETVDQWRERALEAATAASQRSVATRITRQR